MVVASDSTSTVSTVRGPILADELGITLAHDHILFDGWNMSSRWRDYDSILDDRALALAEVAQYARAGGRTICDPTTIGIGRNPTGLAWVSEESDVHIVMGSGWYRERVYPDYVLAESPNSLAERIIEEFKEGVDGTGVRPGFIGEIGTERYHITPAEERVFRAAARAQREIGCVIMTHTTNWGELAIEQIDLLEEEDVPPDRIIISHLGDRPGIEHLMSVAQRGVWMGVDNLGFSSEYGSLETRADCVREMWEAGYGERIMLSNDVCQRSQLSFYGGHGYGNVLTNFVPLLRARGLKKAQIQQMLVASPAKAFSII